MRHKFIVEASLEKTLYECGTPSDVISAMNVDRKLLSEVRPIVEVSPELL